MKMKGKILVLLAAFTVSCVTTVKDFSPAKVKQGEGIIVGRIAINYNDKAFTENCNIIFKGVSNEEARLTDGDWILVKLKTGPAKIDRIACLDGSFYFYDFKNVTFEVKAYPEKTYIGDLNVVWKTKGGMKAAAAFGLVGALADQASSDGTIQVDVKNSRKATETAYRQKFTTDADGAFAESIVGFAELAAAK